jgi:branched-chain amino acid transport system ATP-binding protein
LVLTITSLKKSFGGLAAINGVDLSAERGQITSIIGPNGAGKSTLFNLITGLVRPDQGEIVFNGTKITNLKPNKICNLGVARAFQIVNIFPKLSTLKSIQVAIFSREKRGLRLFVNAKYSARDEAFRILQSVGLGDKGEILGSELSQGDQKRLEIGIALANNPKLLLLDEPTAGMSSVEKEHIIDLINRLSKHEDLTILFTEHDMDVVFSLSDKIWVLHFGRIIFSGSKEEVKSSEIVRKIYLGEEAR